MSRAFSLAQWAEQEQKRRAAYVFVPTPLYHQPDLVTCDRCATPKAPSAFWRLRGGRRRTTCGDCMGQVITNGKGPDEAIPAAVLVAGLKFRRQVIVDQQTALAEQLSNIDAKLAEIEVMT